MMDLAQERERILAKEAYGVKTTRDWNRYHEEWERQHPRQAIVRRVAGSILLWAFSILYWAAILSPIFIALKGIFA